MASLAAAGLVVKLWLISFGSPGGQQSFTDEIIIKLCGKRMQLLFVRLRSKRRSFQSCGRGMSQLYTNSTQKALVKGLFEDFKTQTLEESFKYSKRYGILANAQQEAIVSIMWPRNFTALH